ncbi:MAG: ROK family protein [Candidatus Marinimicrobia bacterium]|nr:ROK family protein [Candidatus Neomarinimicrobiota bacterium]
MAVIGIDLGGTKSAAAIFDENGKIIHRNISPLDKRAGGKVGELILGQIASLRHYASENRLTIRAIGVSIPGIYYASTGKVWAPNIPDWTDYPLLDELTSSLNDSSIRIKIDSDRAAYILGETWQGCAKGCRDAIFIAVGTGIGAGILIDGKILRGSHDIAGATGWMALDRPFQQEYVSCGCFEYHASGEGIGKVARELLMKNPNYSGILRNKPIEEITSHDVFDGFSLNDPIAKQTLESAIEFWGMAVANYVSLFNPEKIIFGGGVFGPAVQFIDRIRKEALKWAQPISIHQVSIEASILGSDAGLFGAGRLAQLEIESAK